MKNQKKLTILLGSILGVLVLTLGITFAVFTYQQTGNNTSQLIMGDIYMHYKENNQLTLNNAMPQSGFDKLAYYLVNPIMKTQDEKDETSELYACIQYFTELGFDEYLDEGSTLATYCQGTGTIWGDLNFQFELRTGYASLFDANKKKELLDQNIIIPENIYHYTDLIVNPIILDQTIEENELYKCASNFRVAYIDNGSTLESFCQGTGTWRGQTIQELIENSSYYAKKLLDLNVVLQDGENYVINPVMVNQTLNELSVCASSLPYIGFDEGSDIVSFCRGTGTTEGKTILEIFNEEEFNNVYGNYFLKNNVILPKADLPYFEFTISGKNTYTKQDIYYDIVLNHGDSHETRNTRLEDKFLKFRLVEVLKDNTEKEIFVNKSYSSLENKRVHVETIPKNTMDEINKTYRLYMWIDNDVVIGNIDEDYTIEEWNDVFASVKVNVSGNFFEKEVPIEYTDESCFETVGYEHVYNSNMTEEELNICITHIRDFLSGWYYDETEESFCNGTGTFSGSTFQELLDNSNRGRFSDDALIFLEENNIIINNGVGVVITDYDTSCGSDVVIPKTINNLPVKAISYTTYRGEKSFADKGLTSVMIPNTIISIGHWAFSNNQLISVIFEENSILTTIGSNAFQDNQLTSVLIPNSVTTIENDTFYNNQLTSVIFEEGSKLEYIDHYAFRGEYHTIREVTIPNSVTYLSCVAFNDDVMVNKSDNLSCTQQPSQN